MGIVDVYDAITTARPYKPAAPPARACEELLKEVQRGWRRPDLVETFIALRLDDPVTSDTIHMSTDRPGVSQ
jgi:response regulator RpfG family c-di-GMP phosphodiesterase